MGSSIVTMCIVDVIDHRGERGGLATARRAGDEQETARPVDQVDDRRRKADLLEAQEAVRDEPAHHRVDALLAEGRDTEAGLVLIGEAEVGAADLAELLELARGMISSMSAVVSAALRAG